MFLTILIGPFIVLQVATVVAILLFLRVLLHRQLEMGMQRIKRLDKENLEKEAELNDKMEKLTREYDARIDAAQKEAVAMIESAKEDSKRMRDAERVKAKEESKKIIANALEEKEKIMKSAQREIYKKAVEFSIEMLKRMFSRPELASFRSKISDDVIDDLLKSDNVKALFKKDVVIEVITSDELAPGAKERIIKAVEGEAGPGANIKFTIDKEMLGGLVLKAGESIIDGGIAHRVSKAALELREEMP